MVQLDLGRGDRDGVDPPPAQRHRAQLGRKQRTAAADEGERRGQRGGEATGQVAAGQALPDLRLLADLGLEVRAERRPHPR